MMKKVVFKPYWNYAKEEVWLNQMAKKGWALVHYCWLKYTFEPCEKGEYVYYIDLLEKHHNAPESRDFIEMCFLQYFDTMHHFLLSASFR